MYKKPTDQDPSEPNKPKKLIVTYKNEQYDITDFVRKHPGGRNVLYENDGKDIEKLMLENDHSEYAYELLARYKLS